MPSLLCPPAAASNAVSQQLEAQWQEHVVRRFDLLDAAVAAIATDLHKLMIGVRHASRFSAGTHATKMSSDLASVLTFRKSPYELSAIGKDDDIFPDTGSMIEPRTVSKDRRSTSDHEEQVLSERGDSGSPRPEYSSPAIIDVRRPRSEASDSICKEDFDWHGVLTGSASVGDCAQGEEKSRELIECMGVGTQQFEEKRRLSADVLAEVSRPTEMLPPQVFCGPRSPGKSTHRPSSGTSLVSSSHNSPKPPIRGSVRSEGHSVLTDSVVAYFSKNYTFVSDTYGSGCPCRRRKCEAMRPESIARMLLDVISIAILLFDSVVIPYVCAWDIALDGFIGYMLWATPIFWTLDMFLSFATGYYAEGEAVVDIRLTSRRYFRTWFSFDCFINACDWAFVMGDWLLTKLNEADKQDRFVAMFRVAKVHRLIRLGGLMRMARIWSRMDHMHPFFVSGTWHLSTQIMKLFFVILWLNHLICCIWYGIGRIIQSDTDITWLASEDEETGIDFYDQGSVYQYTTALHWAMTQMTPGSMEVFPKNSLERAFNIGCLLFGLLFGTSLISQLSAKMVQFQMAKQQQVNNLWVLRRFLRQEHVPAMLAARILRLADEIIQKQERLKAEEVVALSKLPANLQAELRFEMYSSQILRCPVFYLWDKLDPKVIRGVCNFLHTVHLQAGDELFSAGIAADKTYIVSRGCLRYTREQRLDYMKPESDAATIASLEPIVESVVEGQWITKAALWTKWVTIGTIDSLTHSELITISISRLGRAMRTHAKVNYVLAEYRRAFTEHASELPGELMNDLRIGVDQGEVVMYMPVATRVAMAQAVLKLLRQQGWRRWQPKWGKTGADLEHEVRSGRSVLILDEDRSPERIAVVVALRIERADGKVLAQLAKLRDGQLIPDCHLPGSKQEEGEHPIDAAKRILIDKLACFKDIASKRLNQSVEKTTTYKESSSFGLPTKYLRNIYNINLLEGEDLELEHHGCVSAIRTRPFYMSTARPRRVSKNFVNFFRGFQWGQSSAYGSRSDEPSASTSMGSDDSDNHICSHVYLVCSTKMSASATMATIFPKMSDPPGSHGNLYAWLDSDVFERLSSDDGADDLQCWVSSVELPSQDPIDACPIESFGSNGVSAVWNAFSQTFSKTVHRSLSK